MILHDIYTSVLISNNIKANENTLSILYYGSCHIINLTKILSRTGYTIRPNLTINHSYKNEEINRCLDLATANFFFDVENVENMALMFRFTEIFNADLSRWNVGKVENMRGMFNYAVAFNSDLSGWNVKI